MKKKSEMYLPWRVINSYTVVDCEGDVVARCETSLAASYIVDKVANELSSVSTSDLEQELVRREQSAKAERIKERQQKRDALLKELHARAAMPQLPYNASGSRLVSDYLTTLERANVKEQG